MNTTKTRVRLKPGTQNTYYTPAELDAYWAVPNGRTAPQDPTYKQMNIYTSAEYPTPVRFIDSKGKKWRLMDTVYFPESALIIDYEQVNLP